MIIKIIRSHTTRLYTEGTMQINGHETASTIENTGTMIAAGNYRVKLVGTMARRRRIGIMPNDTRHERLYFIECGGSFLTCRKRRCVGIGQRLMPGALKLGREVYDRLFDRLEKAEERGEVVMLTITDSGMTYGNPIAHWLKALPSLLLASALLCGCRGALPAVQVAERVQHDTIFAQSVHYDSVYVDNYYCIEHKADTVFRDRIRTEYRYRLLHDTLHHTRVDSIPVVQTIEVVRHDRYLPPWAKVLSACGAVAIAVAGGSILHKLK